jgi:hypothetical protein
MIQSNQNHPIMPKSFTSWRSWPFGRIGRRTCRRIDRRRGVPSRACPHASLSTCSRPGWLRDRRLRLRSPCRACWSSCCRRILYQRNHRSKRRRRRHRFLAEWYQSVLRLCRRSRSVSGCESGSEIEIESRSRGGRGICRALSVSVCFARRRDRLANVGRVALGCFVGVKGRAGRGRIGKDR